MHCRPKVSMRKSLQHFLAYQNKFDSQQTDIECPLLKPPHYSMQQEVTEHQKVVYTKQPQNNQTLTKNHIES